MNTFSKIDMGEVTRLTRAGKLTEALALLNPKTRAARATVSADSARPEEGGKGLGSRFRQAFATSELAGRMRTFGGQVGTVEALSGLAGRLGPEPATVAMPAGARFEERTFATGPDSRSYKVYVPSRHDGQALPLMLMLHGCTQDPDDFAAGTGMNDLAEEHGFLVAYPRQPSSANAQKCWNWFNATDQRRGGGEPALLVGIAKQVVAEFSADPARVYVAGLSAGGAAAAVLGATYPDVFAAVGVHSGLACGAARDIPSAFAAMKGSGPVRVDVNGDALPTIVFHGDADRTVHPSNGQQVITQATPTAALGTAVTRGTSAGGLGYTRTVQTDGAGRDVLEHWVVAGGGHAWFGGSPSGTYTDPRGPDASREMVRFFLASRRGPART